jgi:transposase
MGLVLPTIEAYQVQHLPIVKAYADKIGVVEVINQLVPTEMDIDPGTIVLGMILDTLSGRSPLYRLEEFFAHQDTALLLGQALAPDAFNDDTVGRVLERLYDVGTMKIFTACAVRADQAYGLDKQYVHFDTTSISVYGDYLPLEGQPDQPAQAAPFTITHGYSKDKRPDLKQFVFSTLCVDRAVPLWGKPEDGNASDKTINNTLLSTIATFLGQHGVAPGAYIYVADAALVTADNLAALGDTRFITRLPATYNECGRLIAEAVAHNAWETVGVLAHTKPTKHRPATSYKVSEGEVTLYGMAYRAVVVHSSAQDKRRQQRLARDIQASYSTMQATVRTAEQQEYFCRADADAAAAQLRTVHTPYHLVDVTVEERPVYGRGRPSSHKPRPIKATLYRLKTTIRPHTECIGRMEEEAGCFVLLTNVPTAGDLAHSAREILTVYKEQHGTEQNYGFLKDPVIVNSLFLKKPARIEALGLVLLLALLIWRLMERAMRRHVDTTSTPLPGWDKKATERPTAFMMVTKFVGVIVLKRGHDRQLARPLSVVQQHYLTALDVPATCFTRPAG